jgi:hypothetical protein
MVRLRVTRIRWYDLEQNRDCEELTLLKDGLCDLYDFI